MPAPPHSPSMPPPSTVTALAVEVAAVKRYLPWVVAIELFMEQLDSTVVNTAVPVMAASLGVAPLSLKAVVASYIVALAVGIPSCAEIPEHAAAAVAGIRPCVRLDYRRLVSGRRATDRATGRHQGAITRSRP